MDKILLHCKKHNISVMVDETYIEFSDNINEICSIPLTNKYDNLFVIRGVSKFLPLRAFVLDTELHQAPDSKNLYPKIKTLGASTNWRRLQEKGYSAIKILPKRQNCLYLLSAAKL